MIVGKLVERASGKLCAALVGSGHLAEPYTPEAFQTAALSYLAQHGDLRVSARYQAPGDIFWDDDTYSGDAYPAYAWAVYVAEVAVDTRTYTATVTDFHALQEVGRVLHPILAAGQIEGGVAQGIGYALYEKCVYADGHLLNNQMTNYIMPTSADLPPIHVSFEEIPSIHGAFGAKGIGELPMDGPAPAILNAIENATGICLHRHPPPPRRHLRAPGCTRRPHRRHRASRARHRRPLLQRDPRVIVLRIRACFAVLVFALSVLVAVAPVRVANTLMHRRVAEPGDLSFTLFYRLVAIVGALASLYLLLGDLWHIAHP